MLCTIFINLLVNSVCRLILIELTFEPASAEKIDIVRYEHVTAEAVIAYIHAGYRIGVLVSMNKPANDDIAAAGRDAAMQIAAMNPKAISKEDNSELSDDEILESQAYIRDASKTVGEVVKELSAKVGENVVIQKIHRFEIGS